MKYDVLAYLESTKPTEPPAPSDSPESQSNEANKANKDHNRRASVAGGQLFSIENNIVESSTDYFQPIIRLGAVLAENHIDDVAIATIEDIGTIATNNVECVEAAEPIEKNVGENIESDTNIPIQNTNLSDSSESSNSSETVEADKNANVRKFPALDQLVQSVQSSDIIAVIGESAESCSTRPTGLTTINPFRRLPNVPFAICGRKRSSSMFELYRPSLETIIENT